MVKPFLEKSKQSLLAAKALNQQSYYNDCVSRAYYSCLQYIIHILVEKLELSREDIELVSRHGTHNKAQYLIELELIKKNRKDYIWFQSKFPELKKLRVDSDYFNIPCNISIGSDAISRSETLQQLLKTNFP